MEIVKVEVIGLAEVLELPAALRAEDGGRATPEVAVVDVRDGNIVVAEFRIDF